MAPPVSASKSFSNFSELGSGQTDKMQIGPPSPGQIWSIDSVTVGDINIGDNMSSVYVISFGDPKQILTDLLYLTVTGNTMTIPVKKEIKGDGVSYLIISRTNMSSKDKVCPISAVINIRL